MITLHDSGGFFKMHWELWPLCDDDCKLVLMMEYIIEVYPILKDRKIVDGIEYRKLSNSFIQEKINYSVNTIRDYLEKLEANNLITIYKAPNNLKGIRYIHLNITCINDSNNDSNITPNNISNITPNNISNITPNIKNDNKRNKEIKEPKETEDINQFKNEIEDITNYFNIKCNTKYKSEVISNNCSIIEILNAGYTVDNFKTVIDKKYEEWKDDSKMAQFIRPATLFKNVSKFDEYLNSFNSKSLPKKKFSLYGENRDDRGNIIDPSKEPEIVTGDIPF